MVRRAAAGARWDEGEAFLRGTMAVVFATLALWAAPARADDFDEVPSPPAERSPTWSFQRGHSGLYVHLDVGVDGMTSQVRHETPDLKVSGGGLGFALAVGGSLSRYLALGGELWETVVDQPDVRIGGEHRHLRHRLVAGPGRPGPAADGLHRSVHGQPASVDHLALRHAASKPPERLGGNDAGGPGGPAIGGQGVVGGQFGVGIGVEGHVFYSNNQDSGNPAPTFDSSGGGVSFSATWH